MMMTIASVHSHFLLNILGKIFICQLWCLSTYPTVKMRLSIVIFPSAYEWCLLWPDLYTFSIPGSSNFICYTEVRSYVYPNTGKWVVCMLLCYFTSRYILLSVVMFLASYMCTQHLTDHIHELL